MTELEVALKETDEACDNLEKTESRDSQILALSKTLVVLATAIKALDGRLQRIEAFNSRF